MIGFFQTLFDYAPQWAPRLLYGARVTILLTASSFVVGLALALVIVFVRSLNLRSANRILGLYVEVVRALPILAILYFVYFGLPGVGILLSPFEAGTIGLGVVYSTYLAEVLRAGVDSLHRGQREAALAVGMPPLLLFRYIVLPQAVRIVLPPLLIALVSLLKDSSICALIAVNELMLSGRVIMSQSFLPLHVFVLIGVIYFAIAWPMSLFVRWLQTRLNRGRQTIGARP